MFRTNAVNDAAVRPSLMTILRACIIKKRREAPSFTAGGIGVGRAGLDAQATNQTQVVPEPSMGERNTVVEAPSLPGEPTGQHPGHSGNQLQQEGGKWPSQLPGGASPKRCINVTDVTGAIPSAQ
jgi:hypothetical protein